MGESGYSGYSGIDGTSGYSGEQGISGYSGTSGYSGEQGISGYSGTSGYSGEQGISGYSGTSGYSGIFGFSGYSGTTTIYTKSYSSYFDGNNDCLVAPASSNLVLGTGNFTIECWINRAGVSPVNAANNLMIIDFRQAVPSLNINLVYFVSTGKVILNVSENIRISSTTSINTYEWYHIALVRSSGQTKLYINGVQEGNIYTDTNNYASNTCTVGGRFAATNGDRRSWFGYISNVRVVKGAAVYTTNFIPPSNPLTAISGTSLLTCDSDVNTGVTTIGNTQISKFNPFGENPSAGFTSVTTNGLNVNEIAFTGAGPVVISSGNDIQLNAAGWITFTTLPTIPSKTLLELNDLQDKPYGLIAICTDASGGARPVWWNGTAWKDMNNGAV